MPRTKGSKNLKQAQKPVNVYLPVTLFDFIKNKNKSKYIRNLIQKDYNKNNKDN